MTIIDIETGQTLDHSPRWLSPLGPHQIWLREVLESNAPAPGVAHFCPRRQLHYARAQDIKPLLDYLLPSTPPT